MQGQKTTRTKGHKRHEGRMKPFSLLPLRAWCGILSLRELDPRFLHLAVRKKPNERFIVKIDNLDAVAPPIAKIAAERRLKLEFIFAGDFLAHLPQLLFVPHHDAKMPHPIGL